MTSYPMNATCRLRRSGDDRNALVSAFESGIAHRVLDAVINVMKLFVR
jgi:hypothetical protein